MLAGTGKFVTFKLKARLGKVKQLSGYGFSSFLKKQELTDLGFVVSCGRDISADLSLICHK